MSYSPRLVSPNVSIKYYRHTGYQIGGVDGVNECVLIDNTGEVMPNCVGYTWGRWYEISNQRPRLSRADAYQWFGYTQDGYERSQTPSLGAILCFSGGIYSGLGHVAVVEKINSDGSIITSNSAYDGQYFYLKNARPQNNYVYDGSGYTFQGFIVNPYVKKTRKLPLIYYCKPFI